MQGDKWRSADSKKSDPVSLGCREDKIKSPLYSVMFMRRDKYPTVFRNMKRSWGPAQWDLLLLAKGSHRSGEIYLHP